MLRRGSFITILLMLLSAHAARADVPPPGSTYSQATITEPDGTTLHADILRPAGLAADARTPVIMSVGPYFGHAGEVGAPGELPVVGVAGDPYKPTATGPSSRFNDFWKGAHLATRGYSFVMVDLRGYGLSTGCPDLLGPGEQADVRAAVEWAAAQPWSTGRVGLYGKSYDAATALMGVAEHPRGLSAVVAQQTWTDAYGQAWANGLANQNALAWPALYGSQSDTDASLADGPVAITAGVVRAACQLGLAGWYGGDPRTAFWRARDITGEARGSKVPTFLSYGFLDYNASPYGRALDFFNSLAGPKRLWIGWWNHVRGNDKAADGRLAMGRPGWLDEVMRFYDKYLKGAGRTGDPLVAVQEGPSGEWRSERHWPPTGVTTVSEPLRPGAYLDDGVNDGSRAAIGFGRDTLTTGLVQLPLHAGRGSWTFSVPLARPAHLAGAPRVGLQLRTTARDVGLAIDVYDISRAGSAQLVTSGMGLVRNGGAVSMGLQPADWRFSAGHRIGVLVSSSNADLAIPMPTMSTVAVVSGVLTLPLEPLDGGRAITGSSNQALERFVKQAPFVVDQNTIARSTEPRFALPKSRVASRRHAHGPASA
jgi:predicted acyl esterase